MAIQLNHVLIRTKDMDKMSSFFVNVLGLSRGARPPFPFEGQWLYSQQQPLIHLINHAFEPEADSYLNHQTSENTGETTARTNPIIDHIAFSEPDYNGLITRLKQHNCPYFEQDVPDSGERQVFIEAPEGLRIEMVISLQDLEQRSHKT